MVLFKPELNFCIQLYLRIIILHPDSCLYPKFGFFVKVVNKHTNTYKINIKRYIVLLIKNPRKNLFSFLDSFYYFVITSAVNVK